MSDLQLENEPENFRRLKKLLLEIGLPILRDLFIEKYSQNHGNWEETPEFGAKLLKMLDDQNSSKETEILKKYEERRNIQSGKVSEWDFPTLELILTNIKFDLELENPSASNSTTSEDDPNKIVNRMIRKLINVQNKLVQDYSEKEKIPTEEFIRLWNKTFDSCYYLWAEEEVMLSILASSMEHDISTISPAISSSETAATNDVQQSTILSPSDKSASTTTIAIATSNNTSTQQVRAAILKCLFKYKGQKESPSFPPAQTSSNSGTENTTENLDAKMKKLSNRIGFLFFMFLQGIFVLVVSSLFLSRLMQDSEESPLLLWTICTVVAVCLGVLKIVFVLLACPLMSLKDPKARLCFMKTFGFGYVLTIILSGVLVLCFVLTNHYGATFFNLSDEEGSKNYLWYVYLITVHSIEPALLCGYLVILFIFALCLVTINAVEKYL